MAYFEDLEIGQAAEATHLIEARHIEAFGHAVGDLNPVHFDETYAAKTPFGGRIAHGMLAGGYISALIASKLPGPGSIYNAQTLDFLRAVRIGDELVHTERLHGSIRIFTGNGASLGSRHGWFARRSLGEPRLLVFAFWQ